MSPVEIAAWVDDHPRGTLAASLYALPDERRLEGAHAARAAGCWLHADLILRPSRSHPGRLRNVGVAAEQLRAVAAALPGAPLDLHLILLQDPPPEVWRPQITALVGELLEIGPARISTSPRLLAHLDKTLPGLAGLQRWHELWPGLEPTPAVDGHLLMLIEPGTKQAADPERIASIDGLATAGPVGVDGGVTREVAARVVAGGASYVVVGRALFQRRKHA